MRVREAATWMAAPLLLIAVATVQLRNVAVDDQSPWSGVGFGMFATFDGEQNRMTFITVTIDGEAYTLVREGDVLEETARLLVRPSESATRALAERVLTMRFDVDEVQGLARVTRHDAGRPASEVTVEVRGVALAGTTQAPVVESIVVRTATARR